MNSEIFSLSRDSEDFSSVLAEGTFLKHGQYWNVLAREVVFNPHGIESVIFEAVPPGRLAKPDWIRVWFQALRLETLTFTLSPVLIVTWMNHFYKGWTGSWISFVFSVLATFFLQVAVNLLNDAEDHLRLVDRPGSVGGSGVVQKGWVSAKVLKRFGYISLGLGVLFGLPVVLSHSWFLMAIGAVGVLGVAAYSGFPFGIKYRALGDFAIFLMAGPLVSLGVSQAVFNQWDFSDLILGTFFGFAAWAAFHAKHIQSFEMDKMSQVMTLPIQVGFKKARLILVLLDLSAYLSVVVGVYFKLLPLSVLLVLLLGLPGVLKQIQRIYSASGPVSAHLGALRSEALLLHFFLSLLALVGFFVKV